MVVESVIPERTPDLALRTRRRGSSTHCYTSTMPQASPPAAERIFGTRTAYQTSAALAATLELVLSSSRAVPLAGASASC